MKVPLTPVRCLERAIDLYAAKRAIVCGERRFTYGEFGERCRKLASALRSCGVRPGDRVGFLSYNTHRLLEGYFGVPMAGGAVMPLNVRLTPAELSAILRHSEPRVLLFENEFAGLTGQLRLAWPEMRTVNLDAEYEEFIAGAEPGPIDIYSIDEDSMAELFYTSGSTGTPKGVALSHRTVYLHALSVAASFSCDDAAVDLHTIPLFHANGWGRPQVATMFGMGQAMVRRFEPATVCRLIQSEHATAMFLVPTMANALLNYADAGGFDLSSLRQIYLGGAASTPEQIARLEKLFPGCRVLVGYGLTETCPVASSSRPKSTVFYAGEEDRLRRQAMAGWSIPGCEIRVVDGELKDVPRDMTTVGEVIMAGDNVMDGYYREPEATAAVMSGAPGGRQWFHSGDMAVWDQENYIHIVDRKKDIIISGGENISSIEVEKALAAHADVMEVAVVGAPDPAWGEIPVAIVVKRPESELTETELKAFIAPRLARFKMPRRFEFVEGPLPKGGTGKILKRELRERYWEGKDRRVQG